MNDVDVLPALTEDDARGLAELRIERFPLLIQRAGRPAWRSYINFFTAEIENDNTRAAYVRDVNQFLDACAQSGIVELGRIEPVAVAAHLRHGARLHGWSKTTRKRKLAAIRRFFDAMVLAQLIERSPALSVRGPKVKVRKGKSPVLSLEELQQLLSAIDRSTLVGKRDYAWLVLAASSWCRVTALVDLRVSDYEHSGKRSHIGVEEKGGEDDKMPVHHKAQEALDSLLSHAEIGEKKDAFIFQAVNRSGHYTGRPLRRSKVYEMIRRRARQAGLSEAICCHSFRATGITLYLKAGGDLERAQARAHHADSRTTKLYDHSDHEVTLEDVELVQF